MIVEKKVAARKKVVEQYHSDKAMLQLIDALVMSSAIKFRQEFLTEIKLSPQNYGHIKNGFAHFTPAHIARACKKYKVNANWIFGMEKKVFRD